MLYAETLPEPKPCPFCGKAPQVRVFKICTTIACSCNGNPYAFDKEYEAALDKWNKRAA